MILVDLVKIAFIAWALIISVLLLIISVLEIRVLYYKDFLKRKGK